MNNLENTINKAFDNKETVNQETQGEIREGVNETLNSLDKGLVRVCEKINGNWVVNQWIKKAILLSFRLNDNEISKGPYSTWFDKVPGKTINWSKEDHINAGFRFVPNGVVRKSAYIAKGVILMPSFVNLGAYVDEGTMIDTWSTVGSCAQIGKNCHISGGAGIGGVLEPLQANPVIVEDNCFIGSRCVVVEGVKIKKEAVLGSGVILTKSTKIIDVSGSKEIHYTGEVPEKSVVIPGTYIKKFNAGKFSVPCALIIGKRKESTDKKTSLNRVLREFKIST